MRSKIVRNPKRNGEPGQRELQLMAETFRTMGDPTRTRIIYYLSQADCQVTELAKTMGHSVSSISHQLRTLRNLGLVKYRRSGKYTYYRLDDDHIEHLFKECQNHVRDLMGVN